MSTQLYRTPFSRAYWRDALRDFRKPRNLVFSALMVAACVVLSYIPSLKIYGDVKITSWSYLARALCALVCGPVNAVVFGVVEDNVGYFMNPSGGYFPGYMLTTVLGVLIYALFFYRAKVTVPRLFFAKLLNNVVNVFLGSLWSSILSGKGYWTYVSVRAVTNAVRLIPDVIVLAVFFGAILPILSRTGLLPKGVDRLRLWWRKDEPKAE